MQERYKKTNTVLGEGSYKIVTKAIDTEEGKEVAYNEVRIKKFEEDTHKESSFSKEIALLKTIDHPNIIEIFNYWFEDESFIFITELMTGGTLLDYIKTMGIVTDKLIQKWGRQILDGINYLHTQNPPIIHRDIKAENIFVNSAQGEIKIGDLGIAKEKKFRRYTIIGTLNYMAREMFEGDGYNETVDIYAFGMTLIQMATARMPYAECPETSDVKKSVLQGCPPEALKLVKNKCLMHLIVNCITAVPNRLTAAEAMKHHFFNPDAENPCNGRCMANACCMIYPLCKNKDILLSMVAYHRNKITFQMQLRETGTQDNFRFIKFEYDVEVDTVEKICSELQKEKVILNETIGQFQVLLSEGVEKAFAARKKHLIGQGMFALTKEDLQHVDKKLLINTCDKTESKVTETVVEDVESKLVVQQNKKEEPEQVKEPNFGVNTIEIMNEIEEEIKNVESKSTTVTNTIQEAANIYQMYMSTTGSTESIVDKSSGSTVTLGNASTKVYGIAKAYEITRSKYEKEVSIEEFTCDACKITGRDTEAAKYWASAFIENDILTTGDCKLLTSDDWEKLNLTVFACRTMQNMLYGQKTLPPRNKQLVFKNKLKEYTYSTPIDEFVDDVCKMYNKEGFLKQWLGVFTGQDLRKFGELKGLTEIDWERIGLSVLGHRIFFNVVFRKGFND